MEDVNYLLLIYYPVPAKFSKNVPASMTPGEKEETCGERFSENPPFFTRGGEEVRVSINSPRMGPPTFKERQRSPTILRPRRMVRERCDNP
jgi:hypothetical protein